MQNLRFVPPQMPVAVGELREEVRDFLRIGLAHLTPLAKARSWTGFDPEFSRKLGARGWIGMVWPRRYGGHERSALERYVVLEELLAAGAPVAAHWIADRQSGPLLLRFGTEEQRLGLLPAIARGELYFCIGLSEPGAGSDLAAVRTRAVKVQGGWRVNGSKLWTTIANHAHIMIAMVRTSGEADARHDGLSQLLIDLSSPGVTVRPIVDMVGERHFNEVFFEDVFVPETRLVGREGEGWRQATAELALERSGPERYLSCHQLLIELLAAAGDAPPEDIRILLGNLAADLWTIRQMSLAMAGALAQGSRAGATQPTKVAPFVGGNEAVSEKAPQATFSNEIEPALEAAIVKDLGAQFEQDLPRLVQAAMEPRLEAANPHLRPVMEYLLQTSTSFSLRGGTREILRGIVARGLGLR